MPAALSLLALLSCAGEAPPASDAPAATAARVAAPAARAAAPAVPGLLALLPPATGASRFVRAAWARPLPGATLEEAGTAALAAVPGLSARAARAMVLTQVLPLHAGAVLRYQAEVDGLPVLDGGLRLLLDGDRRLVAASWGAAVEAGLQTDSRAGPAALDAPAALDRALRDRFGQALSTSVQGQRGGWTELAPAQAGNLSLTRARARPAWLQQGGLRPAWQVELWAGDADSPSGQAWEVVVDGLDGRVLRARDLTVHASFDYTAWVDAGLRPMDGPLADVSPHPTGEPDGTFPDAVAPSTVAVEGLNTNPDGVPDPWLAEDATETTGNNADVYADHYGPDGFSHGDRRASTTAERAFGQVYDTELGPTEDDEQIAGAIVQAFYTVNWLHDWYYDRGFDEAMGNAQADNHDRGGEEGDPLHIEVQDDAFGGSRNNANMSTPGDGSSPRMQVYLWSARSEQGLVVTPGDWEPESQVASFAPDRFDLSGDLALPGSDPLGCAGVDAAVKGAIVLMDRGDCAFVDKARAAQAAGAAGLVIANDLPGAGAHSMSGRAPDVTIPVLSVSYEDGATLAAMLGAGDTGAGDTGAGDTGAGDTGGEAVTVRLYRDPGVEADGALDASVVAHEWGHYLYGRLLSCAYTQCAAINEGHADFVALAMMVREGDDLAGAWPVGTYATSGYSSDPAYYAIRRAPYSTDPAINAFSFRHISEGEPMPEGHPISGGGWGNAEVHNAGEIWAVAMHEAQVAVLSAAEEDGRSFTEAQERFGDILVAGLALAPDDPTFTELRDAILAAAAVEGADDGTEVSAPDAERMAAAFAVRGMGTCARSPARDSSDLVGVVEDDSLSPLLELSLAGMSDETVSCDDDGMLDGGEVGALRVTLTNMGGATLSGTTVSFAFETALPDLLLPEGDSLVAPDVAPFSAVEVALPVSIPRGALTPGATTLTVTAVNEDACITESLTTAWVRSETDLASAAASTDDFSADDGSWTVEGDLDGEIWTRVDDGEGDATWLGADVSGITDSRLVSPALPVAEDGALAFTLTHRYRFEHDGTTAWDGGVLELSVDGGEWQDISTWVDPGYTHVLTTAAENPLGDRPAFSASSAAWPEFEELRLDLGDALAGHSVRLSLRVGTDQALSEHGWELDAFSVEGLAADPFPALVADATDCNPVPLADAGPDQEVEEGSLVTLDGSASADPAGEAVTLSWTVLSGEGVTLSGADGATPTFTAPEVDGDTVIELSLAVDDGLASASDTVAVTVVDTTVAGDSGTTDGGSTDGGTTDGGATDGGGSGDGGEAEAAKDEGGCGCQGGPAGAPGWGLLALLAARRRRKVPGRQPGQV